MTAAHVKNLANSAKDFCAGWKLTKFEETLLAFELLIGNVVALRNLAKSFELEMAGLSGKFAIKSIG
jgi:hypothetical protein